MGWGESKVSDNNPVTLPPHTTCAKCEREIVLDVQDRYRHQWIAVEDLFTNSTRYYHHSCYNQSFPTKGR